MVLGLSLREWREREEPLISVNDSKGNLSMFLRWVDGKAQVADALTKLHGDGDLLRAVCRQAFTELVGAPEIIADRRQERKERT